MGKIIRFWRGELFIKVTGAFPERFMNLCGAKNIVLQEVYKADDGFCAKMKIEDFKMLSSVARKSNCKVVLLKKYGLPFFIAQLLRKRIFVVGAIASFLLWFIATNFVWQIQTFGNVAVTDEMLRKDLKHLGIGIGTMKNDLKPNELEDYFREKYSSVTWICCKLEHSVLKIDLKEGDNKEINLLKKKETGKNLIANCDGVVEEILVREGVPCVKNGAEVKKGDILVSGSVPIYAEDGTVRERLQVDADADILIRHEWDVKQVVPGKIVSKQYTGREKTCLSIWWKGKKLLSSRNRRYKYSDSIIEYWKDLLFVNGKLPFRIAKKQVREYQNVCIVLSEEEMERICLKKINEFTESLEEKGVQIIEKNVKIDKTEESRILNINLMVLDAAVALKKCEENGEKTENE